MAIPANSCSMFAWVISICGRASGLTARIFNNESSKHIAVALYGNVFSKPLVPINSICTVPVVDIPPMKSSLLAKGNTNHKVTIITKTPITSFSNNTNTACY